MAIDGPGATSALAAALDQLTAVLIGEESLDTVLGRVVELACSSIEGCDRASITYIDGAEPRTIASTDPVADEIDVVQYTTESGPCLSASARNAPVSVPSMAGTGEWPAFRQADDGSWRARELLTPLATGDVHVGTLNLYDRTARVFNSEPPAVALVFAQQAAAAVWSARSNERTRHLIAELENALLTRQEIGMAVGIVMANERVTADEAFGVLVHSSQHRNVKLRKIAQEAVRTGATPSPTAVAQQRTVGRADGRADDPRSQAAPSNAGNFRRLCRECGAGSVPRVHRPAGPPVHEENTMAKYLLLKHYRGAPAPVNDVPMDRWTPAEVEAHMRFMSDFAARLEHSGEFIDGQAVSPDGAWVRYDGEGRPPVVDGPFAETKDLIAGWMVIDVDSYERAVELAGELSAAPGAGGRPIHEWLEVRPFLAAPSTVTE